MSSSSTNNNDLNRRPSLPPLSIDPSLPLSSPDLTSHPSNDMTDISTLSPVTPLSRTHSDNFSFSPSASTSSSSSSSSIDSSTNKKMKTEGSNSSSSSMASSSSSWISPSGFHFESHSSSSSSSSSSAAPLAPIKQVVYPPNDIRRLPSALITKIYSFLPIEIDGKCAFFAVCKEFNKFSIYMAGREDNRLDFTDWTAEATNSFLRRLPQMRNVKSIAGNKLVDHNLMTLSLRCRRASDFHLKSSPITNFDCLSLLPVNYLDIDNCKQISEAALEKGLAPLQKLQRLFAEGTLINDQVASVLSQEITHIDLTACDSISAQGLSNLGKRLRKLHTAALSHTKLNGPALGEFNTLIELYLKGNHDIETADFGRYLPLLSELELVDFEECVSLGDAGIAALPNTVNTLDISYINEDNESAPIRSEVLAHKLEQLNLFKLNASDLPYFNDDCLEACSRSSAETLETLRIGECANVTSECFSRCLSRFVGLEYLYVNDTQIDDRALRNGLPLSLVTLDLRDCPNLTPDGYDHLRHLINLESLTVTGMPREKVKLLKDAIPDLIITNNGVVVS